MSRSRREFLVAGLGAAVALRTGAQTPAKRSATDWVTLGKSGVKVTRLAFGTGTHATTSGCLELLATLDPAETANAVDVGCGSGILAIGMAKLWQRPVLGGDNDAETVAVARENAGLNGVGDLCRFVHAAGLRAAELEERAPFDLVVANILAGPLTDLSDSFAAAVRPGGRVVLSGLLVEQATHILATYARRGFTFERRIDLETGGAWWRTLLLRRE